VDHRLLGGGAFDAAGRRMTDHDPALAALLARFEHARLLPPTEHHMLSTLRQFWSELDQLQATVVDPVASLVEVVEMMRPAYFTGLALLRIIERRSAEEPDAERLAGAVGRCVDLLGRRLGPRYQSLALRCEVALPAHATLGKPASA
jgi:hypothetical protein